MFNKRASVGSDPTFGRCSQGQIAFYASGCSPMLTIAHSLSSQSKGYPQVDLAGTKMAADDVGERVSPNTR